MCLKDFLKKVKKKEDTVIYLGHSFFLSLSLCVYMCVCVLTRGLVHKVCAW